MSLVLAVNAGSSSVKLSLFSESEPLDCLSVCAVSGLNSPPVSVSLNAHHMERFHNMFIPEKNYLVDLEGLIEHLQNRIRKGLQCLCCGKVRTTVFGLQTHMRDKGHCMIPFETEEDQLDVGDFYDFRSTYSDDDESVEDEDEEGQEGAKLGARRAEKTVNSDGEEIEETALCSRGHGSLVSCFAPDVAIKAADELFPSCTAFHVARFAAVENGTCVQCSWQMVASEGRGRRRRQCR